MCQILPMTHKEKLLSKGSDYEQNTSVKTIQQGEGQNDYVPLSQHDGHHSHHALNCMAQAMNALVI